MRAKPLLFLLLLPIALKAEPKLSPYEELCLYDNLCSRLRNSDGSKVEPKPAVKKLIETMADPVHDFAKLYGVDPRAVAGAILAENSMNVQMDDEIQNWIVKNNVWGSKKALDAGMTIGPGQINLEPAMAADQYIASLGLRPARSPDEITKLLLTPAGAAEYSAAILRQAQDAYKAEGIDISKRPDILVTLYNFGQQKMSYTDRAKETAKLKLQPRPNFFGMFVAENIGAVEDAIGWTPEKGRYKAENTELYAQGSLNMVTDDFTLQTAPPSCSTDGAGDEGQWRARQSWEPFQNFTPRRSKYLELVGRGIDCQMREWVQLKTVSGEIGWMPKSSLGSVAKPLNRWQLSVSACGEPEKDGCLQKALDLYGQNKLDGRDNQGKYFLTVKKNDSNDPVMPVIRPTALAVYSGYNDECSGMKYPDLKKRYQSYLAPESTNRNAMSRADLYGMKSKLLKQQEVLKQLFGLKDEYEEMPVDDGDEWGNTPAGSGSTTTQYATQNGWQVLANAMQNANPYNGQTGFGVGGMYPNGVPQTAKKKKPSNNAYVQALEYLDKRLDRCLGPEKVECEIVQGKEDLKKFLETDLTKIRKLSDFKAALNLGNVEIDRRHRNDTDAQKTAEEERKKALEALSKKRIAQVQAVRESCANVKSLLPGLHQKITEATDGIEKAYNSSDFEYVLPAFQRACEQAWLLDEFKKNGNKLPDGSTAFNCTYQEKIGLEDFSLDFLSKMELTSDDYSEMLKNHFETAFNIKKHALANPGQASWGQSQNQSAADQYRQTLAACNYNALATAKAVEELAKSPCVETILVKDMTLGKNLGGGAKARVVLDTNLQSSQVAFTMKNDCRTDLVGRPKNKPPFNGGNKE